MKTLARIGIASVVVMLCGGQAEAGSIETTVVPGFSIRNGDWVAVDGLGVVLLGSAGVRPTFIAFVLRSEIGLGGASAGFGPATNLVSGPCPRPSGCGMNEFLGSGMVSFEMRVERMFGLSSWRGTTYVGCQASLAGIVWKPSFGVMINAHDPHDRHAQIATGMGW